MKSKESLKRLMLIYLLCFSGILSAQVFQKAGNGVTPANPSIIWGSGEWSDNSGLYFGYNSFFNNQQTQDTSMVVKWDGIQWVSYPPLQGRIYSVGRYQGDLYAGTKHKLLKFNGSTWQQVLTFTKGSVLDMVEYNGDLICVGDFTEATSGNHGVVGFDGSQLVSYPSGKVTDSIGDVDVINNELWISGFLSYSTFDTIGVKKMVGGKWEHQAVYRDIPQSTRFTADVFEMNAKIYVLEGYRLSEIRNDSAITVSTLGGYGIAEFGSHAYINGFQDLLYFDGTSMASISNAPNWITNVANYNGSLIGFFRTNSFMGDPTYNHVFQSNTQFGLLSGRAYLDVNTNCTYEAGTDESIGNLGLAVQGGSTSYVVTHVNNGTYQLAVPAGNYNYSLINKLSGMDQYLVPSCNLPQSVNVQTGQQNTQDVSLVHDGTIDVAVDFQANRGKYARHGFHNIYHLTLRNPGDDINTAFEVNVTFPTTVIFDQSYPVQTNVNGNVVKFTIPSMSQRSRKSWKLTFIVSTATTSPGDVLTYFAEVTGVGSDADLTNNLDTLMQDVVASCDPNDKNVNVDKALQGLDHVDYHIRFQNVGTDTAYNITIVDTLESYFYPERIRINSSSHDYNFNILNNNILVWTFENILLPDSTTDEPNSQGYVNFTVDVDPSLGIGSVIENDAEIYFDYQPPVHTNHAQTAIVQWIGLDEAEGDKIQFLVYPNPASGTVFLEIGDDKKLSVELIDINGNILDKIELEPNQIITYDINNLSPGIYILNSARGAYKLIVQ